MVNPFPRAKVPAYQRSMVPAVTVKTHGYPLRMISLPNDPLFPAEVETSTPFSNARTK